MLNFFFFNFSLFIKYRSSRRELNSALEHTLHAYRRSHNLNKLVNKHNVNAVSHKCIPRCLISINNRKLPTKLARNCKNIIWKGGFWIIN